MKIANKYFKGLGLLSLMALLLSSCTEFKEFESEQLGPAPSITLSLVSVQDSTFTVSVTSNGDGYASVILLPGSGNPVPEDPENILTGNVSSLEYQSKMVKANQATNFTFQGLFQWALYEVQSAANNADGKVSEVATLTIGTDDTYGPVLSATDPGIGYDPVLAIGGPITLAFDEWVIYDEDKELTFTQYKSGEVVAAGSVEVDGNIVTVTPAGDFSFNDYIWLSYPEGAFTDYAGNPTSGIETYLDTIEFEFVGLFWGVEINTFEAVSITPEEDSVAASRFDILVTFEEAVDIEDVEDGMITLAYDDGIDVLLKGVLVSELVAIDNVLKITQTELAVPGTSLTLTIPEGVLGIGYGNPNAELTASWAIK